MYGSCDDRCTSGKEGTCACSCGGANHGTAKRVYDLIRDGGNASVKGAGLDLFLESGEKEGTVQVTNQLGTKVQTYRSEKEFVKDLGKLIRAGRVEVTAQDAYSRREIDLKIDPERSGLTTKEAERQIREAGATVSRKEGEFRVNLPGGSESTAYYTDDPKDAVATAKAMMFQHHGQKTTNRSVPDDAGGSFSHAGLRSARGGIEADEAATYAWAHRPGQAWPGSSLSGHKISAGFDSNGDLVELEIDGKGGDYLDQFDGNEVNAFLDDVHPRPK